MEILKKFQRAYQKYFVRQPLTQRVLLGVFVYALLVTMLAIAVIPSQLALQIGQASPKMIIASHDIVDKIYTENERNKAERSVPDAYTRDRSIEQQAFVEIDAIWYAFLVARAEEPESYEETFNNNISQALDSKLALSASVLEFGFLCDEDILMQLKLDGEEILKETFDEGITSVNSGISMIQHKINSLDLSLQSRVFLENILVDIYQPSQSYNSELTEMLRMKARDNVPVIYIHEGDLIVREGQIVDEHLYTILNDLGMFSSARRSSMFFGIALYVLIVLLVLIAVLKILGKEIYDSMPLLIMLSIIMTLFTTLSWLLSRFSPFLVLTITAGVLTTVLFTWQLALVIVLCITALIIPLVSGNVTVIMVALIGSIVAIISVAKMKQRSDILRAGLYVCAANGLSVLAFNVLKGVAIIDIMGDLVISMMWGIASVILAIGCLPFFENGFGVVSTVKLLELSNLNRPLLRRLLREAPGTYNHSILVGNLAEIAAETVDADPLLTRVGAFYHDIGKIKRPLFFVENQLGGESPHQKYAPSLSTLIITSHVKDGVAMAKEEKLPEKVIDIIEQHHGKTLVRYFYHQAQKNALNQEPLREEDFRYDGPRPQSKEAGIVMLSDSVEAAVRSIPKPNRSKVEDVVRKIIKERLNDGELDECDLTLKDLDQLARVFTYYLSGMFHKRIAYPERSIADLERSKRLGGYTDE